MSAEMKAKVANPGPLGLLGFGMTTVLLNLHNAGLLPLSVMIVAMGVALGGLAQIIAGIRELVLDCHALEYVSSAGLRVILKAQKLMNAQGSMKLPQVNETIMEVFDITGFADILTIE